MGVSETIYLVGRVGMAMLCLLAAVLAGRALGRPSPDGSSRKHSPRLVLALLLLLMLGGTALSILDAYQTLWGSDRGIMGADWAWFVFDLGVPLLAMRVLRVMRQRDDALQSLADLASRDPLTGLSNRRGFQARAETGILLAASAGTRSCVVVLDIDRFKLINDTHGHPAGDAVLRAVAAAMAGALRQTDVLGRIGGEEFAALLQGADAEVALELAEKLRAAVARAVEHPGGEAQRVTLSAGLAMLRGAVPPALMLEAALAEADAALYRAKQAGRDRVMVAGG